jgi:hypothetical protein
MPVWSGYTVSAQTAQKTPLHSPCLPAVADQRLSLTVITPQYSQTKAQKAYITSAYVGMHARRLYL